MTEHPLMPLSGDGRYTAEAALTTSRTDLWDDDSRYEVRILEADTRRILARHTYLHNVALTSRQEVGSPPTRLWFTDDSRWLVVETQDGNVSRHPVPPLPDDVAHELRCPNDRDVIRWEHTDTSAQGALERRVYRITRACRTTGRSESWIVDATVCPHTGRGDAIDRIVLSPLSGVVAIARQDGRVDGMIYSDEPPRVAGAEVARSRLGWLVARLDTAPLTHRPGSEWRSLVRIRTPRRSPIARLCGGVAMDDPFLPAGATRLIDAVAIGAGERLTIRYRDGGQDTVDLLAIASSRDRHLVVVGSRALYWSVDVRPGVGEQELRLELARIDRDEPAEPHRVIMALDRAGPVTGVTLTGECAVRLCFADDTQRPLRLSPSRETSR